MSHPEKQLGKDPPLSRLSTIMHSTENILTLNEKWSLSQTMTEGTYKLIQLNLDLRPDDLHKDFNILLSEAIHIEPVLQQPQEAMICAVANADSDLKAAFSIFPGHPGCKIIRSIIDRDIDRLAIIRLSLNIFALRVVRPLMEQLPVKRPSEHYNPTTLHDCINLQEEQVTIRVENECHRITIGIVDTILCWHVIEGGISGPRGLTSRIALHLPKLPTLPQPVFSRLLSSSCPLTLSSLSHSADNTLKFNVTATQGVEMNTPISFELQLFQDTVQQPYFSRTPSPYFTPNREEYLDVRLPYDLTVKQAYTLRLYRRFYGPFLGLFVPKPNLPVKMPVTIWLPKTWLEITIVGRNVSLQRDLVIGELYFIASDYITNRGCSSAFTHQVKSSLHLNNKHSCVSVLGTSIRLEDLLSLNIRPRETIQSPDTKTTLAMILKNT
ncbi:protein UL84 [Saimiriine betaherpesvirus 4]|uniref:Protein UL84 n=1 Tax=Saimiriine betaherpesvirus 4 TaxID=1535247 RepID=G8XSY9_9BETA|nr:protein UL84 [Saimiriine betaherpesvirus 4]AEV80935.1 protein UL84 [Saimiriine betaherpesvirus 4]